ncbi:hypothetical protein ANCCEY_08036 [Ancylostoma ceylanicum]|uniref:Uncharacterized protein n=1 Tax=Ancylostoma ceylanicum TaxID=53326 RepID=A0A0D6LZ19_9BILA|nr:hypothetical protein ANCCEY_08036 [Ancylostoma ceylanicum]
MFREEFAELCYIARCYLGAQGTGVDEATLRIPNLHYERLTEGRLAAKVLSKMLGLDTKHCLLRDVQDAAGRDVNQMLELVESLPESASREQLEQLLGKGEVQACLSEDTERMTSFKLRARARYVFGEASRVDEFSKDYECGNAEVENLVRKASRISYGGRITAWGRRVLVVEDFAHPSNPEGDCLLFTDPASSGAFVKFIKQE